MCEPVIISELTRSEKIEVPVYRETTVEEAVIYVCQKLNIKPITRHLFALKYDNNQWASMSTKLWEFQVKSFELRIRFKCPELVKLLSLDKHTFNYYFYQVRHDLISNKIDGCNYEKHKDDLLGLSVVDMYRVMLETGTSKENLLVDYKKYVPKDVISFHKFFLKKPMKLKLAELEQTKMSSTTLKKIYLEQFDAMVPTYMTETYSAKMNEGIIEKDILLRVNPFHIDMPGVQFQYSGKDVWNHLCSFDDLCCISLHCDGRAEISRTNGIPVYLKMNNNSLVSFISLLDGYYRLSVKWTFNLCKDFITPSLRFLQAIKCHGPVGQAFSYKKLEEKRKNEPGFFILRQSENYYNRFIIDVCCSNKSTNKKVSSYEIEHRGEGHFWFSGDGKSYPSILDLLKNFKSSTTIPLFDCIPPSEYDISNLLLCRYVNSAVKDDKEIPSVGQSTPQIIHSKHLSLCPGRVYEGHFGLTQVRKYIWKTKKSEIEAAVKSLKPIYSESYLQEFLELAGKWSLLHTSSVTRLLGVTLSNNVSMVTEFFSKGPLDVYLQQYKSKIEEVDLVEAATYIASALWHMEGEGIVHGYIRCRKILVAAHTENSFVVKLSDPGLHTNFSENDWHWIPPELYDNPNDVYKYGSSDVWAFGTTLWELFSYGEQPFVPFIGIKDFYRNGNRLAKPIRCSREIYTLMTECWHIDPDQRKRPQAAMRDINQQLYQVYNGRKAHSYAAAKPVNRMDSLDTLNDVSTTAFDDSEITSQRTTMSTVDSTHIDMNSSSSFDFKPLYDQTIKLKPGVFGKNVFSIDDDATSICSASSVQSIMLNDFKIVIQGSIGKGFYGEVFRGYIEHSDNSEPECVAVKKLITDKATCLADFEREIGIMKSLKHPNIVRMIGVKRHPEIMLIMEYVPLGSLKCYLSLNKEHLSRDRLLRYSLNVAEGMEYLGQQKIVHRDLASRNVLVADEYHVKISDFGLAQKMEPSDFYMLKTPRELPLRWYAPESLRNGKFSNFSDVWSYGVLLYEMFSFGADPVIKNEGSDQKSLLEVLDAGARLACPDTCPHEIYVKLMMPCWKMKDKDRPSFTEIIQIIRSL